MIYFRMDSKRDPSGRKGRCQRIALLLDTSLQGPFLAFARVLGVVALVLFTLWSIYTLSGVPFVLVRPEAGLDPSWVIGLHLAAKGDLHFGTELVFTYGPLGFLVVPEFVDYKLWLATLTFYVLITAVLLLLVLELLRRRRPSPVGYVLAVAVAFMVAPSLSTEDRLYFAAVVVLYLSLTSKPAEPRPILSIAAAASMLAMASLIKFTGLFFSLALVAAAAVLFVRRGRMREAVALPVFWLSLVAAVWVVAGQGPGNFVPFLRGGVESSLGYNSAMQVWGPLWELLAGWLLLGCFLLVAREDLRSGDGQTLAMIMLNAGFILLAYKHGYVRHDGHVVLFIDRMLFMAGLLAAVETRAGRAAAMTMVLLALTIARPYISGEIPVAMSEVSALRVRAMADAASVIVSPAKRAAVEDEGREEIRRAFPLRGSTLDYLRGRTVDVFPWEISVVYAYGLRWSPRPVFQSYGAYTAKLDLTNARHFDGPRAPESVLYAYGSIDGRYPPADEPATFRRILCNYEYKFFNGGFAVLERRPSPVCTEQQTVEHLTVPMGSFVDVPPPESGLVYAEADVRYGALGKLVGLAFKPSVLSLTIETWSGWRKSFRIVPSTAQNGIQLSYYIGDTRDLLLFLKGDYDRLERIRRIAFEEDIPGHFSNTVGVRFVRGRIERR